MTTAPRVLPPASFQDAVALVLSTLEHELPDSAIWMGHLDRDRAVLRVVAARGDASFGLEPGTEAPLETSYCHVMASKGAEPLCCDAATDGDYGELPATLALGVGSFVGAPLRLEDGSAVGTLCAFHHDRGAFGERQLRLVDAFAALLARELEHARRHADLEHVVEELRRQASTDALTGVANRRAFRTALERGWRRAQRGRGHGHVAIVDVDRFKQVNDRHGHLIGDAILVAVAAALDDSLSPGGAVGRLGGDEFGAVLGRQDPDEWRADVERRLAAVAAAHDLPVTLSIGVAPLAGAPSPEAALGAADARLYEGKERRGRVTAGATR